MKLKDMGLVVVGGLVLMPLGCGVESPGNAQAIGDVRELSSDLAVGSTGKDVEAVQQYLRSSGYFPNDSLAREYSRWRPIVETEPASGVFDESTLQAVRAFQRHSGVPETGVIDAATRVVMKSHRCGVPEGIADADEDPSEKFALHSSKWHQTKITWCLNTTDDGIALSDARNAARNAFESWSKETNLTFERVDLPLLADINIKFRFVSPLEKPLDTLAFATFPDDGGDITVQTLVPWSTNDITPDGAHDLQTVLRHEIGHALGIKHSSNESATMYPLISGGNGNVFASRALHGDDKVAISALYDVWEQLPGCAKDIGVATDGTAWVVGCSDSGDGPLHRWDGFNWIVDKLNANAARVAVGPGGKPWVVQASGAIWRRTVDTTSPSVGTWEPLPGCARDIGIGKDESVWVVGCAWPDGLLFKWNGSGWDGDATGGAGVHLAVDEIGRPWVANSFKNIYRRKTNDPRTGSWEQLPRNALDIGIGTQFGESGSYPWMIGGGDATVWVWDEQEEIDGAPERKGWLQVPGGAEDIAVGPFGRAWVVASNGSIFRAKK